MHLKAELVEFRMSAVSEEDAEQWARSLLHESTGWSNSIYRFRVYQEQTSPLIEYYQKSGRLAVIDGSKKMDEVFEDICALLGE